MNARRTDPNARKTKNEKATSTVKVQVTPTEHGAVKAQASREEVTVSNLFRQGVGLPKLKKGGAMPGAGRPRKTVQA